jgi:hypothetical protein
MKRLATILGSVLVAASAHAQSPAVSLVCGGVGFEESHPMRAAQGAHALTILFATQSGSYVAGVRTLVADPLGDVSAGHDACGPVGQVDITQPGRYRVTATLDGVLREQWVDLTPRGGTRIVLRWPD